ncbi:hypothetical protein FW415_19785 [Chitinophaga sp. XS-30]|nr:hypothetical protein FW415_19785 [Chitinophaga sp. XS-30]
MRYLTIHTLRAVL